MTIDQQFCARCSSVLESGKAPFFEVKIEAVCDPGAPDLEDNVDGCENLEAEYLKLVDQLSDTSGQEATEQIATSRVLFMCTGCFSEWIEAPANGT